MRRAVIVCFGVAAVLFGIDRIREWRAHEASFTMMCADGTMIEQPDLDACDGHGGAVTIAVTAGSGRNDERTLLRSLASVIGGVGFAIGWSARRAEGAAGKDAVRTGFDGP